MTAFSPLEDTSPIKEGGELGPIKPCFEVGRPPKYSSALFSLNEVALANSTACHKNLL